VDPCLREQVAAQGFAVVGGVLNESLGQGLIAAIERALANGPSYGLRSVAQRVPEVARLAASEPVRDLVVPILGDNPFVVQSVLFDKTPEANWNVAWHQDLIIPVSAKVDDPQYGPWSLKEEVWHVQPPVAVLEQMLTVRLHLDDCFAEHGPLRVLAGSHLCGVLTGEQIDEWRRRTSEVSCVVGRGGALLMRPLLLHASSRAKSPRHRRVLHLEFAARPLPGTAKWM
jgi:ectoine hydroxylase-related dioxygenase (phytanoyl-CoA dioxygenase family)